mgnify:CR=1 FL=1
MPGSGSSPPARRKHIHWTHREDAPIRQLETLQADLQPLASSPSAADRPASPAEVKPLRIALLGYRSQPHGGGQGVYLRYLSKALVDNPEVVEVSEVEGNQTSVLELKVAQEDLGKVIGKQGRTARAMRTILSAASAKLKKRSVLEIIE